MPHAVLVPVAEPVNGQTEASKKASLSVIGTPVHDPRARPQRDNSNSGCAAGVRNVPITPHRLLEVVQEAAEVIKLC